MSSVLSWLVLSNSSCGGHREEWARHQAAGQEVICTHRYTSANAQTGRTRKKLVTDVLLQEVLKGESGCQDTSQRQRLGFLFLAASLTTTSTPTRGDMNRGAPSYSTPVSTSFPTEGFNRP